jgi:hypothetical protein
MRHRVQLCCVLLAWFAATGSQWDFVQVFAWTRMLTTYAQSMPISTAAELTFDADKPCALCNAVKSAKQQQANTTVPGGNADQKVLLIFQPATALFYLASTTTRWSLNEPVLLSADKSAPPTPPPRGVFAI